MSSKEHEKAVAEEVKRQRVVRQAAAELLDAEEKEAAEAKAEADKFVAPKCRVYHSGTETCVTLHIFSKKLRPVGLDGATELKPGLSIELESAWPKDDYNKGFGPGLVDLDNLNAGTKLALEQYTPWNGVEGVTPVDFLERWLNSSQAKEPSYGCMVNGDPRKKRKFAVTMTADEYEAYAALHGAGAAPAPASGAQAINRGGVSTQESRRA